MEQEEAKVVVCRSLLFLPQSQTAQAGGGRRDAPGLAAGGIIEVGVERSAVASSHQPTSATVCFVFHPPIRSPQSPQSPSPHLSRWLLAPRTRSRCAFTSKILAFRLVQVACQARSCLRHVLRFNAT